MIALKYPTRCPGSLYMTFEITRNAALETYMDKNIISNLLANLENHKKELLFYRTIILKYITYARPSNQRTDTS